MNTIHFSIAVLGLAIPAWTQPPPAAPEPLLHIRTAFDLVVHLPYEKAAPLFGPEGERAWAGKHWDPKFIYPQPAKTSKAQSLPSSTAHSAPSGSTHSSISPKPALPICLLPAGPDGHRDRRALQTDQDAATQVNS